MLFKTILAITGRPLKSSRMDEMANLGAISCQPLPPTPAYPPCTHLLTVLLYTHLVGSHGLGESCQPPSPKDEAGLI